ncbi:hypothetical protein HDU67_009243 [Dinochytrium kinnereticum]|nr:hypothetical protein HDU67_009243 [Dinochytrium kinnereticum]
MLAAIPLTALALATTAVMAQNPSYVGSTCGPLLTTFNTCIDNALVDVTSQTYSNVEAFCNQLRNDQPAYYQCLCTKVSYSSSCPNDPNSVAIQSSITSFCAAAGTSTTSSPISTSRASVALSSATFSGTGGPVLTIPGGVTTSVSGGGGAVATSAPAAAPTTSKTGAAVGGRVGGGVAVLVGVVLAAVGVVGV